VNEVNSEVVARRVGIGKELVSVYLTYWLWRTSTHIPHLGHLTLKGQPWTSSIYQSQWTKQLTDGVLWSTDFSILYDDAYISRIRILQGTLSGQYLNELGL